MIKGFFKIAWRNLYKQRGFELINIGSFAIAIALVLILALWVQNELRFDNYHPNSDQTYLLKNEYLYDNGERKGTQYSPHVVVNHLQNDYQEIKKIAYTYSPHELLIRHNNEVFDEAENTLFVSKDWFNVFHFDFIDGNTQSFFNHPYSIILSESRAKKYFGTTDIVGERINIDSTEYEIKGVVKDSPSNSSFKSEIFLPFEDPTDLGSTNDWMYFTTTVFVQLKEGYDPLPTIDAIQQLMGNNIQWTQDGIDIQVELLPITDMHFDQDLSSNRFRVGNYQSIVIFSVLTFLLLIVSSINYVNIALGQSLKRMKEIGTRKILGAQRRHVFYQFLIEILLKCSTSLLVAFVLSNLVLPPFNAFFHTKLSFFPLDTYILLLLVSVWCSIIILTGLVPSFYLSSFKPIKLLNGIGVFQFGGKNIRRTLMVSQFVVSISLMIVSITMFKQLEFIQGSYDNDNRDEVFMVEIPPFDYPNRLEVPDTDNLETWFNARAEYDESIKKSLKNEILSMPSIKKVSVSVQSSVLNEEYQMVGALDWAGKDPDYQPRYATWTVDDDFKAIMDVELVAGNWFKEGETTDINNMILNETAVREFNIPQPVIGQKFRSNDRDGVIIGVVKDFHFQNLREKISPMILHKKSNWGNQLLIEANAGFALRAVNDVKSVFEDRFPAELFSYQFLDDEIEQMYREDKQTLALAFVFTMITVLLSFLSLLGMVILMTQQKIKEVGIRKVLGASVFSIVTLMSQEYIKLIVIAILIASPIAWWAMNKWLDDFAYRIEIQWWMFVLTGLSAVIIALITVSSQAIKAAIANPVNSLRDE